MPTETLLLTATKHPNPNLLATAKRLERSGKRVTRRSISPASGRALEILGHAIEYLADEYALSTAQTGTLDSTDPRVEAIQMLMALNRQVYYSCPEVEPILQRIARTILGGRPKQPLPEGVGQPGERAS